MPHSKPLLTSLTSSLKRFNEVKFPSYIISFSLKTLNKEFLMTLPSSTYEPDMIQFLVF